MLSPPSPITIKESIIGWVAPNGTMPIVESSSGGHFLNYTGSEAEMMSILFVTPLAATAPSTQDEAALTNSEAFHEVNTTNVELGNLTFKVAYYAANTLPFTFCGTLMTFDAFTIGITSTPGGAYSFLAYTSIEESTPYSSVAAVLRVVSVTSA